MNREILETAVLTRVYNQVCRNGCNTRKGGNRGVKKLCEQINMNVDNVHLLFVPLSSYGALRASVEHKNVSRSSCKAPDIFIRFQPNMDLIDIFSYVSIIKFHENPSKGNTSPYLHTDGQTLSVYCVRPQLREGA